MPASSRNATRAPLAARFSRRGGKGTSPFGGAGKVPARAGKALCSDESGKPEHGARFHILFLIWRLHKSPTYGYALLKEIRQMAVGHKKTSAVYLALERLEREGLVKSRLESRGARVRKLYQTTPKGWALYERVRRKMIRGTLREFMQALAG